MDNPDMTALADHFTHVLLDTYSESKEQLGYNAHIYLTMIAEMGAVATAKHLAMSFAPATGFETLWIAKRLDLTVEYQMLLPAFAPLFTAQELKAARDRLRQYGLDI